MKKAGVLAIAIAANMAGIAHAGVITDRMASTGPSERGVYSNFTVVYDSVYTFDPVYSDGYVFRGSSGSQGKVKYNAASGTYFNAMTVSIAINGTSGVQILDAANQVLNITTTNSSRVTGTGSVQWYSATFNVADNPGTSLANLQSLTVVLYYGSWGATSSRIGTVQLTESTIPEASSLGLLAMGATLVLRRKK